MTIEARDVYVKADGHEFNPVPDGYVIYQSGRDRVHFLNPTAVIVYELCDGRHSVEQIGREFGGMARLTGVGLGSFLLWSARRDALRFPAGRPLEPQTFVEHSNWA